MSTTNTPPKTQDEFSVPNWTDAYSLDLSTAPPHGLVPALVRFNAGSNGMSFHHSITPDQARNMAACLMILADTAEMFEIEATVRDALSFERAAA